MAQTDENDIQKTAVEEVVDVKQKNDKGPSRLVMASGKEQDVDASGDFIARLQTGNIIIDPTLAEKAMKHAGPPLTVAEALERGDYVALSRMMEAQSRRVENDTTERDAQTARREHERAREAELQKYYDERGGYRDGRGGYYDPSAGTYTDKDGGVVDNYGGYLYKNGSYKSGTGDYFDAQSHTLYGADGSVTKVPAGTTNDQMVTAMQKNAKDNGLYDPNATKSSQTQAADQDHPNADTPRGPHGEAIVPKQEQVANEARNHVGPDLSKGAVPRKVAFVIPGSAPAAAPPAAAAPASKFPTGGTASPPAAGAPDVNASSFFAVDSSISSSKFSAGAADAPPTPADTPDPATTSAAARAKPAAPKSAGPG